MLIEFKFGNFRSFRDEAVLSMEATGLSTFKNSLITYKNTKLLPSVVIYGKNGGGKSNVIRAFWLAVQFIRNAQRTQHEKASIPVKPFLLNDTSVNEPTSFEFTYVLDEVKYTYGFAATKNCVVREYLYHAPKGQKSMVFEREYQNFTFRENAEKRKRQLISETVAPNQLYFAIACTMNEKACIAAMKWFREYLFFSRDYTDIPHQLLEYSEDTNMLNAISNYAKMADLGIKDMKFEIKSTELDESLTFPEEMPEGIKAALTTFMQALSDAPNSSETKLMMGEVDATSFHKGIDSDGTERLYPLKLSDESDGARKLMAMVPGIARVLTCGGVFLADGIDVGLHVGIIEMLISRFQSKKTNPYHAQLIITTHNTELLNMELIRKDQIYFADKRRKDGSSSLYSISEFATPTTENVRKGYLMGKYGATPNVEIETIE